MFHITLTNTVFNSYEFMIGFIVILKMGSSESFLSAILNQERLKNFYLLTSNTW